MTSYNHMKKILIALLHAATRRILKKYNPTVIAVTGSVGKTATKEAIFSVLASKFTVRKNRGNFNTELGVPFTIIGCANPKKNLFSWLLVFGRALGLLVWRVQYPRMLVLELAADRPGDICLLSALTNPFVGVITAISAAHTERLGTLEQVAKEKGMLFKAIPKNGWVVGNSDDPRVKKLLETSSAQKLDYGIQNQGARVRGGEINIVPGDGTLACVGMRFKLIANGSVTPLSVSGVVGEHQLYPLLAAAAIGSLFDITTVGVSDALAHLALQPGRMRIIEGIKHTTLIDDTYNASPASMARALETMAVISATGKKIVVLGDMLELGTISESEHYAIGTHAAQMGIDLLIAVGERSRDIARGARGAGMPEDYVFVFPNTREAGLFVQDRMKQGDVVLIKGSRGMHMEAITRELMEEPDRAEELLVH